MIIQKAGVIGYPIAHSKSPLIHGHWLKKYNIHGEYNVYEVQPENLESFINTAQETEGFRGFNVTIPHKETVIKFCTTVNDEAKKIGAVNTVVFFPNGVIEGRNTDAYGFITNLQTHCPDYEANKLPAVIIGAGGAARAVCYALKKAGVPEIRIVNRTIERAEKLADEFGLRTYEWENKEKALMDCNLVVNTTSLGMTGQEALEINLSSLPPQSIIYDLVYKPLITDLLKQAQDKGYKIVTGIGMLLHQARPGFQAWFGQQVDIDDDLVKKVLT